MDNNTNTFSDNTQQYSAPQTSSVKPHLTQQMLDFLKQRPKNGKFSYADAYIYLLHHAVADNDSPQQNGVSALPDCPHLASNFTILAEEWKWDRGTTRRFIKRLQELNILLFEQQGKELHIYIIE